jgi:hypothetical protein
LQGVVELAEERGFRIFADEASRGLELAPSIRLPLMADVSERTAAPGVPLTTTRSRRGCA